MRYRSNDYFYKAEDKVNLLRMMIKVFLRNAKNVYKMSTETNALVDFTGPSSVEVIVSKFTLVAKAQVQEKATSGKRQRQRSRSIERDETPEKGPGEGDGVTAPGDKPKEIWLDTYDVDYLHEREAEAQPEGFGLVAHRPLQHVVRLQQVVQQPLLVVTATYQPCPITISSQ